MDGELEEAERIYYAMTSEYNVMSGENAAYQHVYETLEKMSGLDK